MRERAEKKQGQENGNNPNSEMPEGTSYSNMPVLRSAHKGLSDRLKNTGHLT